jgi:hypothetical protein
VGVRFWLMGNKPEIIVAPSALAELSQQAARLQSALGNSDFSRLAVPNGFINYIDNQQEKIKAVSENFKRIIAPFVEAGKKWKEQISSLLSKVKSWRKKLFVLPLRFVLKFFEIFIAYIEPSSGKALPFPNSYRSTSPPLISLIK